ncbi:MAG: hypothetical protein ACFUZC_11600 [Chthoniobacteraceae bacterium]
MFDIVRGPSRLGKRGAKQENGSNKGKKGPFHGREIIGTDFLRKAMIDGFPRCPEEASRMRVKITRTDALKIWNAPQIFIPHGEKIRGVTPILGSN